ncbi:MAG: hypothetical protein J3K34DRAFT_492822 [Monoraphidium minutum]|nr:MAG: hypothetical protein J3K34DRAFT_492822 [Monoraphidium minutum]
MAAQRLFSRQASLPAPLAARLASSKLSFTAEPLDVAAFLDIGRPATPPPSSSELSSSDAAPSDGASDGEAEDDDSLEELNPALLRGAPAPAAAAPAAAGGTGYAQALGCALRREASNQLEEGSVGVCGPQGKALPFSMIRDPAVWTAKDWAHGIDEIVFELSPAAAAAVKAAAARYVASGASLTAIRAASDFPLPAGLAARLGRVKRELLAGRGVAVLRGMPLDDMVDESEALAAYLGVCAHVGAPGPQWKCGRLVTHVTSKGATAVQNVAASAHGPEAFNRADAFEMHNDSCADVLGLMCIRQAAEGGESAFCSALAVYNEMLRRGRLDLVAVLAGAGFYRDKTRFHADILPGTSPLWEMPVFSWQHGYLTTSYNANLNKQCEERYPELAGRLSPLQREAMDLFNEIANGDAMKLSIRLRRGDVALINNINVMHSRSTFVDNDAAPRHLVRVWLLAKDSPHQLPRHLEYPRSYSFTSAAAGRTSGVDGLFRMLEPEALYVPLSDGGRAQ